MKYKSKAAEFNATCYGEKIFVLVAWQPRSQGPLSTSRYREDPGNEVGCEWVCWLKRNYATICAFFEFVVCNPKQSSPSLTILVPLWFIINSLVFFYFDQLLFSGFLQFKGYFAREQNNSKYAAILKWLKARSRSYFGTRFKMILTSLQMKTT